MPSVIGKFRVPLKCSRKHQVKKRYNIESLKDVKTEWLFMITQIYEDKHASRLMENGVSKGDDAPNSSLDAAIRTTASTTRLPWSHGLAKKRWNWQKNCKSARLQDEEKNDYTDICVCNSVRRFVSKPGVGARKYKVAGQRIVFTIKENRNVLHDKNEVMGRWT